MGTRKGFPGWVPFFGFGTPMFSRPAFRLGDIIGHARGSGTRRASGELRGGGSFHQRWDPFRKDTPLI